MDLAADARRTVPRRSAAAWLTWFVTRVPDPAPTDLGAGYYWPVWVMLVWGALLVVHTLVARKRRITNSRRLALPPGG
jgi:hypothetical protein